MSMGKNWTAHLQMSKDWSSQLSMVTKLDYLDVRTDLFTGSIVDNLVDEGAVLDVVFEDFARDPPPGYDKIMLEQSLLET